MVLFVVDPTQAMSGADVGSRRWRLLQHHRDRLLMLGLLCGGEIARFDLRHSRRIVRQRQHRQTTDQTFEQVTRGLDLRQSRRILRQWQRRQPADQTFERITH